MTRVETLIAEYADDHRHPVNAWLHKVCVPIIFVSLLGLLRSLPVPAAAAGLSSYVNWATLAGALALLWYLRLCPRLAAGIAFGLALALLIVAQLARVDTPLWLTSSVIFAAGWIAQFIGHVYEGRRPSFFRDLRFLLVGPLWGLATLYRRLGIRV